MKKSKNGAVKCVKTVRYLEAFIPYPPRKGKAFRVGEPIG